MVIKITMCFIQSVPALVKVLISGNWYDRKLDQMLKKIIDEADRKRRVRP